MSGTMCGRAVTPIRRLFTPRSTTTRLHSQSSSSAVTEASVLPPPRIQRSPTDILKALAGTVGRDTTGPHYKYIDDPYLTPCSNLTKRSYALSKESGRKAARWVRDQYPNLFTHRPDEPFVQAFYPRLRYEETDPDTDIPELAKDGVSKSLKYLESRVGFSVSSVRPGTLQDLAHRGCVSDAITVYHMCCKADQEIEDDVLQSFLECLCLYNCEEALESDWLEERWYRQGAGTLRKTWKDGGLAEEVFGRLKNKGSAAYCALIRGMSNYHQVERAWALYKECQDKGVPLDTGTYNALICVAPFLRDASDLRWQLLKELLECLGGSGCQPTLGTLNATLQALTHLAAWRHTKQLSLQVLAEFHQLGIEPSLATYYHLLTIHCRSRGAVSHILVDILDQVEGKSYQPQDLMDSHFFVLAMDVARNHIQCLDTARRVDALLNTANNYKLIGDSYKESVYYRHLFALSCSSLPIQEFMEVYADLVPHVYTPEPGVMQEVLKAVEVSGDLQYLPQLWSDMIIFDHSSRENLVALVLSALTHHRPHPPPASPSTGLTHHHPDPAPASTDLTQRLGTVVKDVWARVQGQAPTRRNKVTWSGQMLSDAVECCVTCGEYSTAKDMLHFAYTSPSDVLGSLTPHSLSVMLHTAIQHSDNNTAVLIVLYSQDNGLQETGKMAQMVRSRLSLTPKQRAQVTPFLATTEPMAHSPPEGPLTTAPTTVPTTNPPGVV